ncbi:MAG: hypothetical protein QM697_07535 [Lachnospiraceae bacterium]
MNNLLNKMERRWGKYAIHNLSLYIIIGYVLGYLLRLTGSVEFISLNPDKILHGQVWRLVTWILVPPSSLDIFTIIMLFFYYSLGNSLEKTWGAFRYNMYILSGMLFTVVGSLLLYAGYVMIGNYPAQAVGSFVSTAFSTYYINLSIFLAFAACYPDMQILLYFIIPIKIKWLAYVDVAVLAASFFMGNMAIKIAIITSLLNFILFFFGTRNYQRVSPKEIHRRHAYKQQVNNASGITKHKCAVCGRTELDGDHLEFRFCSKCNGNYEYCQDHLFTHEHIH